MPVALRNFPLSPPTGQSITVSQGYDGDTSHNLQPYAVDLVFSTPGAVNGAEVRMVSGGTIVGIHRTNDNVFGLYVTVWHDEGFYATYAHFSLIEAGLSLGVHYSSGQLIGRVGSTGSSTGPHLHIHFGTRLIGDRADGSSDLVPPAFFASFFPPSETALLVDANNPTHIRSTDIFGTAGDDGGDGAGFLSNGTHDQNSGLLGTTSAERMFGGAGNDLLKGNGGNDDFVGGSGRDTLDGGTGSDWAYYYDKTTAVNVTLGGTSNAVVYVGGVAEDTVRNIENIAGGSGGDTLIGDSFANYFFGYLGNDVLRGGGGFDTIDGGTGADWVDYRDKSASVVLTLNGSTWASAQVNGAHEDWVVNIEKILGGSAGDWLTGDSRANTLSGRGGWDTLRGEGGNDTLYGGAGRDTLTGGIGQDFFVFNSPISASTNVDRITDFNRFDDTIILARSIFAALPSTGTLPAFAFRTGSQAADGDDRVIYNSATGALIYDSNGSLTGGATQIATLGVGLGLTSADFLVI